MANLPQTMEDAITEHLPLSGMVTKESVAAAVAFFAGPDGNGMTGHALPVDRGYTAAGYQLFRAPRKPAAAAAAATATTVTAAKGRRRSRL